MPEIRFHQLSKNFGTAEIIKPLDLVIRNGEFFTFVGPSGCGKSTLLNIIAGLEPATSGDLQFDNTRVNNTSPRERDVAMVFQSYALYPHMTVFENIAFPLRMKKKPRPLIESAVAKAASLLGIEELLSRKPKELSGGQRQRVALGRAIVRKPAVFLMDEPLSNLDARLRIEMRAELKLLHRRLAITTIYVTHDQAEAMGLSDRIAVLQNGEIQQCDIPEEVYRRPANVFVAGFIGSPPMNFVPCRVRKRDPLEIEYSGFVHAAPGLSVPVSSRLLMGIRPEQSRVGRNRQDTSIEVTISVVEPAGSFDWAEVDWKGTRLRAMADPGEHLKPGQKAHLRLSFESLRFFDEASGRRL